VEIRRSKPVPLYRQLKDSLAARINAGEFQLGDRIPSERQICDDSGLSRSTVRQALRELTHEGLIRTVPGMGTYVCAPRSNLVVNVSLAGFSNDVNRQGMTPSSRILDTRVIAEPEQMVVDRMRLQPGDGVIVVERLRYVNNVPLAVHRVHINRRLCPEVLQADLAHVSLFSIFREECGLELTHAEEQVYAALADERELELLHLTYPASVLRAERSTFLASGEVIEFALATYCGEWYRLNVTMAATG
jgi:GntR family transcriptional regulator, N-acetylglucosamine utilization regulator